MTSALNTETVVVPPPEFVCMQALNHILLFEVASIRIFLIEKQGLKN
jgi:hypothetical protein